MKRLLPVLAALLMLASCGPKHNFTIVGRSLSGSRAGGARLVEYLVDTLIQSKVVTKDGVFNIRGYVEEPRFARVVQDDGFNDWLFILEPGVIYLDPDSHSAYGTPLNDAINGFFDGARQIYFSGGDVEDPDARSRQLVLDFVAEHRNDIAGAYVMCSNYNVLTVSDMREMLQAAGPVFRDSDFVARLKSKIRELND